MQYLLNEAEFTEYQQLKANAAALDTDAEKTSQYLSALAAMKLNNWAMVSGRLSEDVVKDIDRLHTRSEQRLLRIWQGKDPDFFERKLAWALLPVDGENDQAQTSEQLAAVNT